MFAALEQEATLARSPLEKKVSAKLGRLRAQALTLAGKPRGFFVQYDYASSVQPPTEPYPEVEKLCAASDYADFLRDMASHIDDFRAFGSAPNDPRLGADMLSLLDGMAIYTAVKRFKPRKIIEIGSGDSTHFLAKSNAEIICIDPAPRRSIDQLRVTLHRRILSNEDADLCATLEVNDILFIDSSHIMLPGTDVDIEFNRIFPRLKPGVIVHIHDIFLPFDYPPHWRGRHWSEQNALVGWLFGTFDIIWPAHYVARRHASLIDQAFTDFAVPKNAGSMWLRRKP